MAMYNHKLVVIMQLGEDATESPEIFEARLRMPESIRKFFIGPFRLANGFTLYLLLPSGGKQGGEIDSNFDRYREQLLRFFGSDAYEFSWGDYGLKSICGSSMKKTKNTKEYQITLNELQLYTLMQAIELHERLAMGQFSALLDVVDPKHLPDVDRDLGRKALDLARSVLMPGLVHPNQYYGIHSSEVHEHNRVLFDMLQVIRNKVAWTNNPQGGMTVNFDTPMKTSNEDFIKIEVVEKGEK
jgi:hypothetical protein